MHELAIAQSILDLARQHVPEGREGALRAVHVRVGPLSGVVPESLAFCFEAVVRDTLWGATQLVVDVVPVTGECPFCGAGFAAQEPLFLCPQCGEPGLRFRSGDELQLTSLEVDDLPAEAP